MLLHNNALFYAFQVVDAYALIGDVAGLAEKIQSFYMQEVISETHAVLKTIVLEVLLSWKDDITVPAMSFFINYISIFYVYLCVMFLCNSSFVYCVFIYFLKNTHI